MSLKVALQMDPVETIDINGDSTFAMNDKVKAYVRPLTFRREKGNHYTFGDTKHMDLRDEIDVILMRQDPPFHMGYITATHILEHIHPKTFVVNDPASVRNAPEKIFLTRFPELMPPTMIASNADDVRAFRAEYNDIIVKPLYGNGGAGVFRISEGDQNLASLIEMFQEFYTEPFIVQKYLSDVRKGDKRIILVDGEPVGAINRVPDEGEVRSNMHVGGEARKTQLTEREKEICDIIGPVLKEQDQIFVGIDVIGDYLTEINVTSPTGIQEIQRFDGTNIASLIWDAIERRI
jgi:glutathione synthase